MPDYPVDPLDLSGLRTYPLKSRKSKVGMDQLGGIPKPGASFRAFWDTLPDVLAAQDLKELVRCMKEAHRDRRAILWGVGAHVIKVGLSPLIIHLMEKGYVNGLALNGAGIIHDKTDWERASLVWRRRPDHF
jgi:deoxyhypusine synthase